MKKKLTILGSTGSIGTQALEVVSANPDQFEVTVLTAANNVKLLKEQALKYKPDTVVIANKEHYKELNDALFAEGIKVFAGEDALSQVMSHQEVDMVLTATVGFSGLKPTMAAIDAGKQIALANKETLVVAGELVTKAAKSKGVNIFPVDSEHSAIFQSMAGEFHNPIEKIYLTASGGPFRGMNKKELAKVTRQQALKHPNWDMGAKITIDSASMMNKGLEVIEAKWLFSLDKKQIDVIVHPQSIIHSIVQFEDGSMKAQMGLPDMKLPIQYALAYPDRLANDFKRFNFLDYPELTFEAPDLESFRNLQLAYDAMEKGGNMPCILNAANEVVVDAFLKDKIGFLEMSDVLEKVMDKSSFIKNPAIDDFYDTDKEARELAVELIGG
jgi:1-deoxy-D-xylulose-5-phosphate reductoisomerase